MVLVAVQLSVIGLSLPPVLKYGAISAPDDHFGAGPYCHVIHRTSGALVVLVAVQLSVLGLYLPPVFRKAHFSAPDDHFTASPYCRWPARPTGALVVSLESTYHPCSHPRD